MSEWIKGRRPRRSGHYLVYAPDFFESEQGVAFYDKDKKMWGTAFSSTVNEYITHFYNLPEPPKD